LNPKRAYAVEQKLPVASFVGGSCAGGYCAYGTVAKQVRREAAVSLRPHQKRVMPFGIALFLLFKGT